MTGHATIVPGMTIVCADGVACGTVEGTDSGYLRTAPTTDGHRHFIPLAAVARVEDAVHLRLDHMQLLELL